MGNDKKDTNKITIDFTDVVYFESYAEYQKAQADKFLKVFSEFLALNAEPEPESVFSKFKQLTNKVWRIFHYGRRASS